MRTLRLSTAIVAAVLVLMPISAWAALPGNVELAAVTAATPPPTPKPVVVKKSGTLASVSGSSVSLNVNGTQTSYNIGGSAVITIDGQGGLVNQLKAGMKATITTSDGTVTIVNATTPVVKVIGLITAINGGNITVGAAAGPVTFTTDANTIVKVAGKAAAAADLKVGMKVTAAVGLGVADTITATIPVVTVSGLITAVNGQQITVETKTTDVTFGTDAGTVIKLTGKLAAVGDMKPGMKVKATTALGIARTITATIPKVTEAGLITAINGVNLTVQESTGPTTFATDAETIVKLAGKAATLADLKVGMKVTAITELGVAAKITATIPKITEVGLITAINGVNLTVQESTGPTTFATDAETIVKLAGKAATLADLKVGMKVTAITELGVASTITATIPVVKVVGTITAVDGGNVTVQPSTGAAITFSLDANTVVKVAGKTATAAQLAVGMTTTSYTKLGVATTVSAR